MCLFLFFVFFCLIYRLVGFREIGPPDEFSCFFQSMIQFLFFFVIFFFRTLTPICSSFLLPVLVSRLFLPWGFVTLCVLRRLRHRGLRGPGAVMELELKVFTPHPPTLPTLKKRDSNTVCLVNGTGPTTLIT